MKKEDFQRLILEQLGLSFEDLPEPEPPSEDEIHRYVTELLDIDKAAASAKVLVQWPDHAVPAIRLAMSDSSFLKTICSTEQLQNAFGPVIELLCKSAPELLVEQFATLLELPQSLSEQCIETAFRHDANRLVSVFSQFVEEEQLERIRAALVGIRAAAWKHGFTVTRENPLYQLCLRICMPDYPSKPQRESATRIDPAIFVCQSFGSLAVVDLASLPYFGFDNPHFKEILCWLPAVVSHASAEITRSEFARAVEQHLNDAHLRDACRYFIPLAAKKLGSESRDGLHRILSSEPEKLSKALRGSVVKALAIVECGRDPFSGASDAIKRGEIETLSTFQRVGPLFLAFDGEVRNGGVFQFLFNTSGIHASETLDCLRLMNDLPGQALLEAGIAAVTSEVEAPSAHMGTRQLGTVYLRKKFRDSIAQLEKAYYDQSEYDLRLYSFVLQNVDQFRTI